MKKNLILKLFLPLSLLFVFPLNGSLANANNQDSFYAEPLLSGLPIINDSGYFNLKVKPNTYYSLPLFISNNSNRTINVKNYIKGARTADNGNIVYNDNSRNSSSVLSQIETDDYYKENKLKPHSSKIVIYNLHTNSHRFKGTQLAGINTVFHYSAENDLNYINGIALTESVQQPNSKSLVLGFPKYDEQNRIYLLHIKNKSNTLFQNVKLSVYSNQHLIKKTFNYVSIAPHSQFNLKIPSTNFHRKITKIDVNINNKLIFKKNINRGYNYNYVILWVIPLIALIIISLIKLLIRERKNKYEKI